MSKKYECSYALNGDPDDWELHGDFKDLFEAAIQAVSRVANRQFRRDTLGEVVVKAPDPSSCTIILSETEGDDFVLKIREVPHGDEK